MASVLYDMGGAYRDAAASIVMNILEERPEHQEALFQYARIAYSRGMLGDAIRVLLRVLAQRPDATGVRCCPQ